MNVEVLDDFGNIDIKTPSTYRIASNFKVFPDSYVKILGYDNYYNVFVTNDTIQIYDGNAAAIDIFDILNETYTNNTEYLNNIKNSILKKINEYTETKIFKKIFFILSEYYGSNTQIHFLYCFILIKTDFFIFKLVINTVSNVATIITHDSFDYKKYENVNDIVVFNNRIDYIKDKAYNEIRLNNSTDNFGDEFNFDFSTYDTNGLQTYFDEFEAEGIRYFNSVGNVRHYPPRRLTRSDSIETAVSSPLETIIDSIKSFKKIIVIYSSVFIISNDNNLYDLYKQKFTEEQEEYLILKKSSILSQSIPIDTMLSLFRLDNYKTNNPENSQYGQYDIIKINKDTDDFKYLAVNTKFSNNGTNLVFNSYEDYKYLVTILSSHNILNNFNIHYKDSFNNQIYTFLWLKNKDITSKYKLLIYRYYRDKFKVNFHIHKKYDITMKSDSDTYYLQNYKIDIVNVEQLKNYDIAANINDRLTTLKIINIQRNNIKIYNFNNLIEIHKNIEPSSCVNNPIFNTRFLQTTFADYGCRDCEPGEYSIDGENCISLPSGLLENGDPCPTGTYSTNNQCILCDKQRNNFCIYDGSGNLETSSDIDEKYKTIEYLLYNIDITLNVPLYNKIKHCLIKTDKTNNKKIYSSNIYCDSNIYSNFDSIKFAVNDDNYQYNITTALDKITTKESSNSYTIGLIHTMYSSEFKDIKNIINSYSNLDTINTKINELKDNSNINSINTNKTKKIKNFQYYEISIITTLLLICIILTIVFNLNNKQEYVKYLLSFLIMLFIIIYIIDNLYVNIEKFDDDNEIFRRTKVNDKTVLYGFKEFKDIIKTSNLIDTISYSNYSNTINNINSTDYDNYYKIYEELIKDQADYSQQENLNKLATTFEILNVLHKYSNKLIFFKVKDESLEDKCYISKINKNLKKEVDKYKNVKESVKSAGYRIQEQYNNLYMTTLSYRDIIYLLIYLTIISILINVIIIEYNLDYVDKKILALYIFLFFIGIVVYLYRYMIRVRVNPHNKYF